MNTIDGEAIIQARIRGESARHIAKRLGCTLDDINDVLDRFAAATITNKLRTHTLALELARLDELTHVFEKQAKAGDPQSGLLVTKIIERRCLLLGIAAPPRAAPQVDLEIKPAITSTERIKAAIDRIRGLPKPEAEATPEEAGKGEPEQGEDQAS